MKLILILFILIQLLDIKLIFCNTVIIVQQQCPDKNNNLKKWSEIIKNPIKGQNLNITIPLLLDVQPKYEFGSIKIFGGGMLVWKHISGIELKAKSILIYNGGQLIIGSVDCKFKYTATITLLGNTVYSEINETIGDGLDYGQKVIGVGSGGTIELHGETPSVTWVKLTETISPTTSSKIITLSHSVKDWPIGSKILLTTTDYDIGQSEINFIEKCPECRANQIKLKSPIKYLHWGKLVNGGIDERGEVALLTRNIKIQGQLNGGGCKNSELVCKYFPGQDIFGAHIIVQKGFKNAHFDGVQLFQVGQSHMISRYPIHFHMCGRVDRYGGYADPAYIQHCSVEKSFSRCYVIHGTDGLLVHDNIGYDSVGHCFMLCDGIEMGNTFSNNLGVTTRYGLLFPHDRSCDMCTTITPLDFNGNPTSCLECNAVSTFWISNPNNTFINNVAVGSESTGIWFIFPDYPSGMSYAIGVAQSIQPYLIPVTKFKNNIAHSCTTGLQIDNGIKVDKPSVLSPQQTNAVILARYKPRSNPKDINSKPWPSIFDGAILYKNRWRGGWARGGFLVFYNFHLADNAIGFTIASEGTLPEDPTVGQQMYNSIFIGESENIGQQSSNIPLINGRTNPFGENGLMPTRGFEIYDGTFHLENITFLNYRNVNTTATTRNSSAIGFFRFNDWQESSENGLKNLKFINVDKEIHFESTLVDGDKTSTIRDLDGTITGIKNSVLVRNFPYYNTDNCDYISKWDGLLCREDTRQLFLVNGNLPATKLNGEKTSIISIRDNNLNQRLELTGTPTTIPGQRNRFQFLIYKNHLYDFHFPHPTPPLIIIQPMNWQASENVTIGICTGTYYGLSITVLKTTSGTYGNSKNNREIYPTSSKELISESTYYHDPNTSMLYVLYYQENVKLPFNYCPAKGCEEIVIKLSGSSYGKSTGDCQTLTYSSYFTIFDDSVNRKFINSTLLNRNLIHNSNFSYQGESYFPYHPKIDNEIRFQCIDQQGCIPAYGIKYFECWVNGGIGSSFQHITIQLLYNGGNYKGRPYYIEPYKFQSNTWTLIRIPFDTLKYRLPKSLPWFNGLVINSQKHQKTVYFDNIKLIYDN